MKNVSYTIATDEATVTLGAGTKNRRTMMEQRVVITCRDEKPWVARVISWPIDARPTITGGSYRSHREYGDDLNGGTVQLIVSPGDTVCWGVGNHPETYWGIVHRGKGIEELTAAEARQRYNGGGDLLPARRPASRPPCWEQGKPERNGK